MDLRVAVSVFSTLILLGSLAPYLIGVIKGTVKPRIVTWFIWAVLNTIACVATIADGQILTAIFISCFAVSSSAIVILGWKNGSKQIDRFDAVCLIGAVIGIILWQIFNSPAVAVIAMLLIDLIGSIPTVRHSWQKPNEEQWVTFMLSFLGSTIALFNVIDWKVTAMAYPLYMVINNLTLFLVVVFRKYIIVGKL